MNYRALVVFKYELSDIILLIV